MTTDDGDGHDRSAAMVYLVLSHSRIPQLLRLICTLRSGSPQATVVVHHDGRVEPLDTALALEAGADHVIGAPEPVWWGDLSMVEALLRSLRWIDENVDYDWVVQLSGQDYPGRPLRDLERHLALGSAEGYVRHERVGSERDVGVLPADSMVRRYFFRYRHLPGGRVVSRLVERAQGHRQARAVSPAPFPGPTAAGGAGVQPGGRTGSAGMPWRRFLDALRRVPLHITVLPRGLGTTVGWRVRSTPFVADYPCWKGSFWTTLSRPAVREVLAVIDGRLELLAHYRQTMGPEESVLPTVLANSPNVRLSAEPLRFVSWIDGSAHPRTLGIEDLSAIEASNAFVARKFDETVDAEILDALDRRLRTVATS